MSTATASVDIATVPGADEAELPDSARSGLYLYGIARARPWRNAPNQDEGGIERLRVRDIEALVRAVPFQIPDHDQRNVRAHQYAVDAVLRHGTILPVPFGIVFRGREALLRFLEEQHDTIEDGLAFLDGHWEIRLHIRPARPSAPSVALSDLAMQVYADLRRGVRAAVPFPGEAGRLLGAAFLVERDTWLDFMHHAEELGTLHPDVLLDITGPWPAYDFVRITT
jgi:hypothetical protein